MPVRLAPTDEAIADVARRLRAGQPVAIPTETVYGLAADATSEDAIAAVYALKGRPADNPLIVHVTDLTMAATIVETVPPIATTLARHFWPGPLTLILRRSDALPAIVTGGRGTVAVRSPRHHVARAVLQACALPLAAPSANRSGHISPTTAQHVLDDFDSVDDLHVLDGGPCPVGIESTVLDLTSPRPTILRPGWITPGDLAPVIGDVVDQPIVDLQIHSPGTSDSHYAPTTPADLIDTALLAATLMQCHDPVVVLAFEDVEIPPPHRTILMPEGAAQYAAMLYDALRRADAEHAARILIQSPPTGNEIWAAVHDRLRRATA